MSEDGDLDRRTSKSSARAGLSVRSFPAVVATAVVAVFIVACGTGPAPVSPKPTATRTLTALTCNPSGCAVVSISRSLPPLTIFYGASCSGGHGPWFLNVTEGGGSGALRPAYVLLWSFASGSTAAKPSGQIAVPPSSSTQLTLTLTDGTLRLAGTRKPNTTVTATGTLTVQLAGGASAPELRFTETGLRQAEQALGLVSPFDVNGQPLTLPVELVKKRAGC
jgi:hypothetical protein